MATQRVAAKRTSMCAAWKNLDEIRDLSSGNARHVEGMVAPGCPRITEIKSAVVSGDQFIRAMSLVCASSEGPMANQRMTMKETVL